MAGGQDPLAHLLLLKQISGWVLCGDAGKSINQVSLLLLFTLFTSGTIISVNFGRIEETPTNPVLSIEERTVVKHFENHHHRTPEGRFVVPLPRKPESQSLGESRSQAVKRFLSLERSLARKGQSQNLSERHARIFGSKTRRSCT